MLLHSLRARAWARFGAASGERGRPCLSAGPSRAWPGRIWRRPGVCDGVSPLSGRLLAACSPAATYSLPLPVRARGVPLCPLHASTGGTTGALRKRGLLPSLEPALRSGGARPRRRDGLRARQRASTWLQAGGGRCVAQARCSHAASRFEAHALVSKKRTRKRARKTVRANTRRGCNPPRIGIPARRAPPAEFDKRPSGMSLLRFAPK